ncbi:hypothetical protein JKF63_07072 [Porcisia hertigi]|uniref:Uncharacterized protein n=1 Tax=Porcisia hertigi TaxID=2761500 RepID=A0A836IZ74_9TRYP|nr:hypothetical protein JKF63_07072 [Porcisia hertigi]
MHRSEDGKVDVAVRRFRAWSAPAAPLSHICGSHDGAFVRCTAGGIAGNPADRPLPPSIYRLFPTRTAFTEADIPFSVTPVESSNGVRHATGSSQKQADTVDALRAELIVAKNQIELLNTTSKEMFHRYGELEAVNAELRDTTQRLRDANDDLEARLAQRDEMLNEQQHIISHLEKKLEEFNRFKSTALSSGSKSLNGDPK